VKGLVLNLPSGVRVTAAFTGVDDSDSLVVVVDVSSRDEHGISALVVRPTDAGLNVRKPPTTNQGHQPITPRQNNTPRAHATGHAPQKRDVCRPSRAASLTRVSHASRASTPKMRSDQAILRIQGR
jgi:hypothetical protein